MRFFSLNKSEVIFIIKRKPVRSSVTGGGVAGTRVPGELQSVFLPPSQVSNFSNVSMQRINAMYRSSSYEAAGFRLKYNHLNPGRTLL
mmetsp:Transcript_1192/g.2629  ORF Transcript_1192/g.2629 Transcript_1192/m.2629 type:complete len:88 (-) Transcript_1192:2013-2276(-)